MMRMKAGLLPPWESPTMNDLQIAIDKVYGEGEYKVKLQGPWWGLVHCITCFELRFWGARCILS